MEHASWKHLTHTWKTIVMVPSTSSFSTQPKRRKGLQPNEFTDTAPIEHQTDEILTTDADVGIFKIHIPSRPWSTQYFALNQTLFIATHIERSGTFFRESLLIATQLTPDKLGALSASKRTTSISKRIYSGKSTWETFRISIEGLTRSNKIFSSIPIVVCVAMSSMSVQNQNLFVHAIWKLLKSCNGTVISLSSDPLSVWLNNPAATILLPTLHRDDLSSIAATDNKEITSRIVTSIGLSMEEENLDGTSASDHIGYKKNISDISSGLFTMIEDKMTAHFVFLGLPFTQHHETRSTYHIISLS